MRWISSFIVTSLVVLVATGILWLRENPLGDFTTASDFLKWALPDAPVLWIRRFQIPLIFGIWAMVRIPFQWVIAYSESQTEASPRDRGLSDRLNERVFIYFHNTSRWWLAPYVGLLTLMMTVVGGYIWVFNNTLLTRTAWGLSSLFVATLTAMMIDVDNIDRLTGPDDSDRSPDPLLTVPET